MNKTVDPAALFEEAKLSGMHVTRLCVQSVLRQVALESLGQNMDLELRCQNEVVTCTHHHVKCAQEHCRQMANCWSKKLKERGFHQVADIVVNVARLEEAVLFHLDDAKVSPHHEQGIDLQSVQHSGQASPAADGPQACESYITSTARICGFTMKNVLDAEREDEQAQLTAANRRLNQCGLQMQTDWPFPWKMIENKVRSIPDRLYSTKREASVLELIPRPVWEKQQDDERVVVTRSLAEDTRQLILQRKRRRALSCLPPARKQQNIMRFTSLNDVPRSASTQSESIKLRFLDVGSDNETTLHIHRSLHSETDLSSAMDGTLFGSLLSFGHSHYVRQLRMDDSRQMNTRTARQIRLAQQKAIKERLGSHSFAKYIEETKSRVQHTVDAYGYHWFDFDIGRTLLELGKDDDKMLYWFDSIEAMLLDEEDSMILKNDEFC